MSGRLSTHAGASEITRAELKKIEAPKPTKTWMPIKHFDLLVAVEEALKKQKIEVAKEHLAVQRRGMFFFGVLDLKSSRSNSEYTSSLGLRSSNNKIIAIQIAVGARVFVCDNLMFRGDLIALRRKHTTGLYLADELDDALTVFGEKFESLSVEIGRMKDKKLALPQAKELIFDLFIEKKIMPIRLMDDVAREYLTPTYEAFKGQTLWTLQNAFTTVAKVLPEDRKFRALRELGEVFSELVQ